MTAVDVAAVRERIRAREEQAQAAHELWHLGLWTSDHPALLRAIDDHDPLWVLADCERDRGALDLAAAQAERHPEVGAHVCALWTAEWPCPDYLAWLDVLAGIDAKYEPWR